jgi:hypothetical protein
MRQILLISFLLLMASVCYGEKHATLSAPPGHYDAVDLGSASDNLIIGAKVSLTGFDRSEDWPPAAYVGFYDEEDRNNKFQFLIIRNNSTDNYIVAGYRLIEEGKQVKVASISNFTLNEIVETTLNFKKGKVKITVFGHDPVVIGTKLKKVIPYISVSSGEAKFVVALNKQRNTDSGADAPPPVR